MLLVGEPLPKPPMLLLPSVPVDQSGCLLVGKNGCWPGWWCWLTGCKECGGGSRLLPNSGRLPK